MLQYDRGHASNAAGFGRECSAECGDPVRDPDCRGNPRGGTLRFPLLSLCHAWMPAHLPRIPWCLHLSHGASSQYCLRLNHGACFTKPYTCISIMVLAPITVPCSAMVPASQPRRLRNHSLYLLLSYGAYFSATCLLFSHVLASKLWCLLHQSTSCMYLQLWCVRLNRGAWGDRSPPGLSCYLYDCGDKGC